ncbi:hypothetical protein R6Q57_018682 [Mikania cordata]
MYDAAQAENSEKLSGSISSKKKWNEPKDIESEARKLYEQDKWNKFTDYVVFNEVMCKHQKWALQLDQDTRRSREEETPTSGGSTSQRPIGRDVAKAKGKEISKVSTNFVEELRAMRLTRDGEIELMKQRLEFEREKE